jgi:hypothetical protein
MSEDNEVRPCCGKYSKPHEQCDRYPACEACQHLIADEAPAAKELSQYAEPDFDPPRLYPDSPMEAVRDSLY